MSALKRQTQLGRGRRSGSTDERAEPRSATSAPSTASQPAPVYPLPPEGLVRLRTVLSVFPVGESTWWAGIKSGRFPKPVHIGVKSRAWRVADIRALIAAPSGPAK